MKIGVLSASKLAIPSLYYLAQNGIQFNIILPNKQNEDIDDLEYFLNQSMIPYEKWNKEGLNKLAAWKELNQLDHIWVMTFPYIFTDYQINSLNIPILNFHFAPLPEYRGAQPVFWMIKNQERKGGISIHLITSDVDAGSIVHFEKYELKRQETFGSYMKTIAEFNIHAIAKLFQKLHNTKWLNEVKSQKKTDAKYYPKPTLSDITIDWNNMNADQIEALCRACNPWNKGAVTYLNNNPIKIIEVEKVDCLANSNEIPGSISLLKESSEILVSTIGSECLKLNIVSIDEGIISGTRLKELGFTTGAFQSYS